MKHVSGKLGNMRKIVDWVVYPESTSGPNTIVVQSNTRICQFNRETGQGILSKHCPNGAYFMHLNSMLGAKEVEVPSEFVEQCIGSQPKSGDQIGVGVYVA